MNAKSLQPVIRIGLWGAPGSGKTTFLAALNAAMLHAQSSGNGTWTVRGAGDADEFLVRNTNILTIQRRFPPASQVITQMSWRFNGDLGNSRLAGRVRVPLGGTRYVEFRLDLQDVPGGYYRYDAFGGWGDAGQGAGLSEVDWEHIVQHLARCDALVYLFDPVREARYGDSFEFFQGTLQRVARRADEWGRLRGPRLPHHLAVCVTKFDHPTVFHRAVKAGFVTQDSDDPMLPRVGHGHARQFFERVCKDLPGATAEFVKLAIETNFDAARVAYFVTSSVGFWVGQSGRVDLEDCFNVNTVDGEEQIRGRVRPINVLEPLVWLQTKVSSAAGR